MTLLLLATSVGCDFLGLIVPAPASAPSWPTEVLPSRPPRPPSDGIYTETEPNDTFEDADVVAASGDVDLVGTLAGTGSAADIDIFRLPGGQAEDRVHVTVETITGSGVVVALLDARQRLLAYLDPMSRLNSPPEIDLILREPTDHFFVVVTSLFPMSWEIPYTVRFSLEPVAGRPLYRSQVLVLNFDGADDVRIGYRTSVAIPPFDVSLIDERLAGQTQIVAEHIVAMVREDFRGLGLAVYRSGDPAIPQGPRHTVHFGLYDERLLGLAENIDPYNSNPQQEAIVFTDSFALFSVFRPSAQQIAQTLANVASHEAGHLLGLRHTRDVHDIMDTTASARQMMVNQWFRSAQLHETVLPVGFQDSPALLAWTLGGQLVGPTAGKVFEAQMARLMDDPNDFHIPRELLSTCTCGQDHDEW